MRCLLLIEDSVELQALVAVCLGGWEILEAAGGEEALAHLRLRQPDLILLDSQLEDGSAQQWFPQLRSLFAGPIVWFSSKDPGPDLAGQLAGQIQKPFDPLRLQGQLLSALV